MINVGLAHYGPFAHEHRGAEHEEVHDSVGCQNVSHQRACAIRVDLKTDPTTAGFVACGCYFGGKLFWEPETTGVSHPS